ncbi:MAG: hypothetical protein WDN29_09300 [Methylovirgula sp.]
MAIIVMQTMPINNCTQRLALLFSETMTSSPAATLIFYAPLFVMARECADRNVATQQFFLRLSAKSQSFAMFCDAAYSLSAHFHALARVDKAI